MPAGRPKSTTALGNNVLIRISAELKKQLEEEAAQANVSFSAHCREILATHCNANHQPRPLEAHKEVGR